MDPDETQPEAPKKKGKGKLFGIIGGVVVVAIGGYMFLGGGGGEEEEPLSTTTTLATEGAVIEAEEMTVNLADPDPRYARIRFAVVLPMDGDSTTVGERFPILKDGVVGILADFTADDLLGDGGLDSLREQLTEKAQEVWPGGEVLRVVVTEMIVQ